MEKITTEITFKSNQHLRTAQLMRFLFFAYSAFIVGYLLLVSLGLLGDWTAHLGFAAFCFAATIIYVSMKSGYRQYKRHIELANQYAQLKHKLSLINKQDCSFTDDDVLKSYNVVLKQTNVIPSIGGNLLALLFI